MGEKHSKAVSQLGSHCWSQAAPSTASQCGLPAAEGGHSTALVAPEGSRVALEWGLRLRTPFRRRSYLPAPGKNPGDGPVLGPCFLVLPFSLWSVWVCALLNAVTMNAWRLFISSLHFFKDLFPANTVPPLHIPSAFSDSSFFSSWHCFSFCL